MKNLDYHILLLKVSTFCIKSFFGDIMLFCFTSFEVGVLASFVFVFSSFLPAHNVRVSYQSSNATAVSRPSYHCQYCILAEVLSWRFSLRPKNYEKSDKHPNQFALSTSYLLRDIPFKVENFPPIHYFNVLYFQSCNSKLSFK